MARQMKDSGIEWIGMIPENWKVGRTKNHYTNHKNVAGNQADSYERLALTLNGVIKRSKEDSTGLQPEAFNGYQILRTNELVFKLIDLENISTSRVGLSPYTGIVSPAYIVLEGRADTNMKYGEYYFLSMWQRAIFNQMGDDGVRSSLNASDLLNIPYIVPSLDEQDRIATFLDTQCAHIDTVIEKTKASIEEYKKLKQAVITQAVTKGVRGDRPMKDSGIEWIGEIPEEWEITKVFYCLSMKITDGPHTTPELYDEGIAFISAEAVSCGNGKIDFSHKRGYISHDFYEECCKKYIPRIDDIYMIKSGATTGRVSIVDTLEPIFTIWSPLAVFRCNKDIMVPMYLFYYLQSTGFQKQVELGWTYGTQQNIGMRTLEQLKINIPSVSEQAEIADYLKNKCVEIDVLISKKQEILTELESYKKSLIYEYVTGKKEVPDCY